MRESRLTSKIFPTILGRNLIFMLIVFTAFFLRLYKVTQIPPSLNWDEVSIGYNAYSVLKTGKDEWGKFLPLHFQSYGEYKLPAQIYASIPGIWAFGLNPFGVRITPVIYGTLTVLLLYFLTLELSKNKYLSLISSLFLAVSPWHIQLTRASFESSFSVFWIVLGIWLLLKGFNGKKYWWIISMIPFTISVYTYNSARVFTPLFLLTIFTLYFKKFWKHKKEFLLSLLLFVLLLLPLLPFVLSGEASARYKLVSITNEAGLTPRLDERRNQSKLPFPIKQIVHNRYSYISYYFASNYLAHFSPEFLFINGASHKQHHVQGLGELYKFQAPFILLGLYFLFKQKEKHRWLLLCWLFLAFVPVATTRDSIPNALRTMIANPVYQILTAYGLIYSCSLLTKKSLASGYLLLSAVIILGFLEFSLYLHILISSYPQKYSRDWQYGYKEAVFFLKEHYEDYDLIVFSRTYGEPHMFTLFYLNYSPEKYMDNLNLVRYKAYAWVWVLNFDKFYFPDLGDEMTQYEDIVDNNPDKKILFIGKKEDFSNDVVRLKTIDFLNGERAFDIVEYK